MSGQERQSEGGGEETGRRLLISDKVGAPASPGGRSSDVRRRGRSGSGGARAQARGQRRSSGLRGLLSSRWSLGTRAWGVAGRCLGSTPARGVADWSSGRSARDELLQDTGTRKGVREEEREREERAGAHGEAFVPGSFEETRRWGRPMLCSVVLWPGLSGGGGCGIGWIEGRRMLDRC